MSQEAHIPDAGTETPSGTPDDGNGAPDVPETPSGQPESGPETPSDDDDGDEHGTGVSAGADNDDDDEAWQKFEAKFKHIKSPRDRRAAMANWIWEQNNYASRVTKDLRSLKEEFAELRGRLPKPEDEPDPILEDPQVQQLDGRIKEAVERGRSTIEDQNKVLIRLNTADKKLAVLEYQLEEAKESGDTYKRDLIQAKLEAAQEGREAVLDRYKDLKERQRSIDYDIEKLLAEKDWVTKLLKGQRDTREKTDHDLEVFNETFPQHVDSLIDKAADEAKAPEGERTRRALWKHVNRALMLDLQNMDGDVERVNIPAMVNHHVKEWLEDHDLIGREKFGKASGDKLRVAGRRPGGGPAPAPPKRNEPMSPSLMQSGSSTPAMLRARKYLQSRGL